jgi:hypothetical protein
LGSSGSADEEKEQPFQKRRRMISRGVRRLSRKTAMMIVTMRRMSEITRGTRSHHLLLWVPLREHEPHNKPPSIRGGPKRRKPLLALLEPSRH